MKQCQDMSDMFRPDPKDNSGTPHFWLGIACALVATTLINLGANIQKKALDLEGLKPVHTRRPMLKVPLWLGGFALYVLAQAGNAVGLAFGPQSLIVSLGSFGLVTNLFFASCLHRERIGMLTVIAVIIIMLGISVVIVFGSKRTAVVSGEYIRARWGQMDFVAYMLPMAVLTVAMNSVLIVYEFRISHHLRLVTRKSKEHADGDCPASPRQSLDEEKRPLLEEGGDVEEAHGASSVHSFSLPASSGTDVDGKDAAASIQSQHSAGAGDAEEGRGSEDAALVREEEGGEELDTRLAVFLTRREVKWLRVLYPVSGGLLAGWSVLLTKSSVELVRGAFEGQNFPWEEAGTFYIVGGTIASYPLQVLWLNRGLQFFEAVMVNPVFYCISTISCIVGGLIFFKEYHDFCTEQYYVMSIGILIVFSGVLLLFQRDQWVAFNQNTPPAEESSSHKGMHSGSPADQSIATSPPASPRKSNAPLVADGAKVKER